MEWNEEQITWEIDGKTLQVGVSRYGSGPVLLLLPALSSISTRHEMRALQGQLGSHYATVAVDWPGFGDLPRPKIAWAPAHYQAFLTFLLTLIPAPAVTVSAGHACGYALAQAAANPGSLGRQVLLSPTWRGPLPTMTGKRLAFFSLLAKGVDVPVAGSAFYRLNVNGPVIGLMARGHVYSDPSWLTKERLAAKRKVTEAPGARYSSFRFVTGELDLFTERELFLDAVQRAGDGVVLIYGTEAPRKSKAEMVHLGELPNVAPIALSVGKLSFYEEFPDLTSEAILTGLSSKSPV